MAHQSLSYRSYRSYKSYASATPPPPANHRCHQASIPHRHIITRATPSQHAYHRCHQKSPAYPCGKFAPPSQNRQRPANPRGIQRRTNHYLIGLIGLISLMQAPHRRPQTAVAIRQAHPSGISLKGVILGCQKVLQDTLSATYPAEPDENV